ncbi:MAG: hypothetical protein ACXVR1_15505 [Solirubrobacteraceae bacterium]
MSALALEPRVTRGADPVGVQDARTGVGDVGGEPTLDAVVSGVWEGLAAHRSVACPLCGHEMTPVYGAHARPIGGSCRDCGTRLS